MQVTKETSRRRTTARRRVMARIVGPLRTAAALFGQPSIASSILKRPVSGINVGTSQRPPIDGLPPIQGVAVQTLVNGEGSADGSARIRYVAVGRALLDARPARQEAIDRLARFAGVGQTGVARAIDRQTMAQARIPRLRPAALITAVIALADPPLVMGRRASVVVRDLDRSSACTSQTAEQLSGPLPREI